jgi:hybrid cluster-associated redox disulfide protein
MVTVTEDMLVSEIMDLDADVYEVFQKHGLNCVGCPGSYSENLKEAAKGHGINLSNLITDLNKYLNQI